MRAGRLRRRVTIQQKLVSLDTFGGESVTWEDLKTVWAEVLELRGQEYLTSSEEHAQVTVKVRIRYRADVSPTMRLLFGDRMLEIVHAVDLQGRHRELELMCSELVT